MKFCYTMRLAAVLLGGFASVGWAHTFEQSLGIYADSAEVERRQVGAKVGFDFPSVGQLESSTMTLGVSRDEFIGGLPGARVEEEDAEELDEVFAYSANLAASQTWNKLTELRQSLGWNRERQARSVSTGIGVSRWFAGESFRFSFDYVKNRAENPGEPFLDKDFEVVSRPDLVDSEGVALGLRHLATPKTIVDYTVGYTAISNRPPASLAAVNVRQYIESVRGALLGRLARLINTGELTTQTTYGNVSAWEASVGWVQTLWSGATGLVEYRNYRETEVTRAYGDELQLGSDAFTVGLDQKWEADDRRVYHLTTKVSRYETNIDVAANMWELGLGAQF